MKRILFIVLSLSLVLSASAYRKQMTEKQAWEWHKRVGVIKGFNQPEPAYTGQTNLQIMQRAKALGFNSVRFWIQGNDADETIAYLRQMIADASKCGLTVSPVIRNIHDWFYEYYNRGEKQPLDMYEKFIKRVVGAFRSDERIVMWDVWNEPDVWDDDRTRQEMEIIIKLADWCHEVDATQPITSCIFWDTTNKSPIEHNYRRMAESKMDLHNFHSYELANSRTDNGEDSIRQLQSISNRPLVCTECLTRPNGSGMVRSLAVLSRYGAHFYSWGLFANDSNWDIRWHTSAYDPYDPMFHNVLYADGDIIDSRDIEALRSYHFAKAGEEVDPGLPITDRWAGNRAWQWMVTGPIKGKITDEMDDFSHLEGYNAARVKLSFESWRDDREKYLEKVDAMLAQANDKRISVVITLLTDDDRKHRDDELCCYVADVIHNFYADGRVKAWELYHLPGKTIADASRLESFVDAVFTAARHEYPNQPMFITPLVDVKPFAPDFNYREALGHGNHDGWSRLRFQGGSSSDLVYKIWSLRDVTAFATSQSAPEVGWMASVCFRVGRPIFCTEWTAPTTDDIDATLSRFALSHVFWFTSSDINSQEVGDFRFEQIVTTRQR